MEEGSRKEIWENQFESQVSHTVLARTRHFSLGLNFLISKSFTPLVWNLSSASNVCGHVTPPPRTQGGPGGGLQEWMWSPASSHLDLPARGEPSSVSAGLPGVPAASGPLQPPFSEPGCWARGRSGFGDASRGELAEPHRSHFKSQAAAGPPPPATHEATAAAEPPPLRSHPTVASR